MAIIKKLDSSVGVGLSYHRILGVNINYDEKKVNISLAPYVDLEKRIERYKPLEIVDIGVPKGDFKLFIGKDPIKASYKWLKQNVEGFDKSKDDLEVREVEINE